MTKKELSASPGLASERWTPGWIDMGSAFAPELDDPRRSSFSRPGSAWNPEILRCASQSLSRTALGSRLA